MKFAQELLEFVGTKPKCGNTHVISIDGRAGSGKTTLAHELFLALAVSSEVTVLHLDELYAGWTSALGESLTATLNDLIVSISSASSSTLRIYDWQLGTFASERILLPPEFLILEGVGSSQSVVRDRASACIWMDIDAQSGLSRVLQRDGTHIQAQMKQWQIDEDAHFAVHNTRENSDFILSTQET